MRSIVALASILALVCPTFAVPLQSFDFPSFLLQDVNVSAIQQAFQFEHPHTNRSVIEIIDFHGYPSEAHQIVTSDGYILELHRIPGNPTNPSPKGKAPVLLMHGLICSSSVFVLTGPERALGFVLADAGYDVWMGNVRGSRYSRKHERHSVLEPEYWNFSWHEIGTRDVPAMIDYTLQMTGHEKLFYIGHSQGTTVSFVTLSELPEYNNKIHALFQLAPITYSSNMYSPFFKFIAKFTNSIDRLIDLIGKYEFEPSNAFIKKLGTSLCNDQSPVQIICKNIIFLIVGYNNEQMETNLLPAISGHLPAGASVKQFIHYGQIIRSGLFCQYDHGKKNNNVIYGQKVPPAYNISNVRIPVSLHYSSNDWLSGPKDVELLYSKLPNPIGKFRIPEGKFNHVDFIWAKDVKILLYNKILGLMSRYKNVS